MTLLAYSNSQGIGAVQYPFADLAISSDQYYYSPQADIIADIEDLFDLSNPIQIVWTISTWIPNTAQNTPIYNSVIDKWPLGNVVVCAAGQSRSEYFIQHIAQASGQYTFWLNDELLFYPYQPEIGSPIDAVNGVLALGISQPLRGDSLYFALDYGLEADALLTAEYFFNDLGEQEDTVTTDFFFPGLETLD